MSPWNSLVFNRFVIRVSSTEILAIFFNSTDFLTDKWAESRRTFHETTWQTDTLAWKKSQNRANRKVIDSWKHWRPDRRLTLSAGQRPPDKRKASYVPPGSKFSDRSIEVKLPASFKKLCQTDQSTDWRTDRPETEGCFTSNDPHCDRYSDVFPWKTHLLTELPYHAYTHLIQMYSVQCIYIHRYAWIS